MSNSRNPDGSAKPQEPRAMAVEALLNNGIRVAGNVAAHQPAILSMVKQLSALQQAAAGDDPVAIGKAAELAPVVEMNALRLILQNQLAILAAVDQIMAVQMRELAREPRVKVVSSLPGTLVGGGH